MNISKLQPLLYILYLVISSYTLVIQISCARVKVPLRKNSRKEMISKVSWWILCSLPFVGIVELYWFASLFLNCKTIIISIIVLMLPFWCQFHLAIAAAIFSLQDCKHEGSWHARNLIRQKSWFYSGCLRDPFGMYESSRLACIRCYAWLHNQSCCTHEARSNMHSGLSLWFCGCCIIQ